VWVTRLVMLIGTLFMLSLRRSFKLGWTWKILLLLLLASMLESIGYLSFNLGISQTYTTITTALASLYSAVTVLLAWLFLRERLSRAQAVGIAVVLAGVLFVSL
jgi:drug/metabolite transporter (DMT)-like permease